MSRERIVIILTIIIAGLGLAVLNKYKIISEASLSSKSGLIGNIKDIITILAIIIGAVLTYFKFFAGQTFTPKAQVDFQVTIIENPQGKFLHTVKVIVTNLGNLTIWNPKAEISAKPRGDGNTREGVVRNFIEKDYINKKSDNQTIIDPGERVSFVIWREFDKNIWAVTYTAEVSSDGGRKWQNMITVPNRETA